MWRSEYYDTNRHACYKLTYHMVIVTKYRHPVFTEEMTKRLIDISKDLLENHWGCTVLSVNTDADHVHVLFSAGPQVRLSELVNNYKTTTSRMLRLEFAAELTKYYWKPYFWADSYYIGTVGDTTEETVRQYIEDQGKPKRKYRKRADKS